MSAFGFLYMLWRYNWSCRLSTLFSVGTLWCIDLAITPHLQGEPSPLSLIAFLGLGFFMFLYAVKWACYRKAHPNRKP